MTDSLTLDGGESSSAADRVLRDVWDDNADEEYRRDISHWRGAGRWNESAWAGLISTAGRRIVDLYRTAGRRVEQSRPVACDWGCGGGASLLALAPFSSRLFAVDVSQKNLDEASRQLRELDGAPPMVPLLVGADPISIAKSIDQPLDLFVSMATFHLLPAKELGENILRTAFAIMKPTALGFVTIRYDDGSARYRPRERLEDYGTEHLFAMSWEVTEFWALLERVGFSPLKVANLNLASHFCSFYFRK